MLYFRTNILVLVLASLSLASWGGTTTVTAQETTDVPVATDAPVSADTGEMPILTGVDTPTEAPVAAGAVDTPTEAPVVGGVVNTEMPILVPGGNVDDSGFGVETPTSAMPSGNTPTGGEATTTTPPVAGIVGADYCTYSPNPACYSNNGKPDCCLDDAVECPAEAAPCDVVDGSETEAPTGGAATTTPPVAVVDDVSAPPTPQSTDTSVIPTPNLSSPAPTGGEATTTPPVVPSPNPTQAPSAGVPLPGSDYCTYSPDPACYSNSGKPECCMNEFIDCPEETPPCDVVGTDVPTKAPIVFAGFQKCSANDVCKEDGLEGNCCPNDDGTVLDCCYGITESPVAAGTDPSESPTSMTSGGTPTGGPIDDAEPTTSVPTTEAAVPAVTITTPPPQPETTPTQEQTPEVPKPDDNSESSSSSNVDINISAAVKSGVHFVAVAVGVVTTAVVAAVL